MIKLNTKLAAVAGLSAVLLAGCGGGGGGGGAVASGSCPETLTIPSGSVVDYNQRIIAFGENTQPIDINCLTLATDDTAEPTPII